MHSDRSVQKDLRGKTAVVTGAGGVLCSAFAKALAGSGANVALLGYRPQSIGAVEAQIRESGGSAKAYCANVLDKGSLLKAHEEIRRDFGPCHILINGAGGNNAKATTAKEYFVPGDLDADEVTFFNIGQEAAQSVFDLNFMGTLLPTQVFARDMASAKGGAIINVTSMNAFTPLTKIPAYSAAKAAISNFTQWMAVHFSKVNIRVNAIAPGFFATNQNKSLLFKEDGSLTPRSQKIIAATPMGRFGKKEELIGTLLYLVDDDASGFVTGIVIPVDGGFSAYSGV
ncbi:SDR family oxidoreductase [Christensenellaceae bacterium OttesenSCG-928-M15]|nr:SDR family oxidoreductase [Christensenellaceae bacterium OttesenSCG-928-M15]